MTQIIPLSQDIHTGTQKKEPNLCDHQPQDNTCHYVSATSEIQSWILKAAGVEKLQQSVVSRPKNAGHGQVASNIAMILAKPQKRNPMEIAGEIAEKLQAFPELESVQIAKPGFLNMVLKDSFWKKHTLAALKKSYGSSEIGKKKRIHLEFVSANPTGPLHIGHARGAVLGDSLANLLKFHGFDVVRSYYCNDRGKQIQDLGESLKARVLEIQEGVLPEDIPYPGEDLIEIAHELIQEKADDLPDFEDLEYQSYAITKIMEIIKQDLRKLGIWMNEVSYQSIFEDAGDTEVTVQNLRKLGWVKKGVLPKPKSASAEEWVEKTQDLFLSSKDGDDQDRPLKRDNGEWSYLATDLAWHNHKIQKGFHQMINIWGTDHSGYVSRMQTGVKVLGNNLADLKILLTGIVKLLRDDVPVKVSKRSGQTLGTSEVCDEIGKENLRFLLLTRKPETSMDFDLEKAKLQNPENPVFYVQYAHARICSAMDQVNTLTSENDLEHLNMELMLPLMQKIAEWPQLSKTAMLERKPHMIPSYLQELAAEVHTLWGKGKSNPEYRIVKEDFPDQTQANLTVLQAAKQVFQNGLDILGIKPKTEMR